MDADMVDESTDDVENLDDAVDAVDDENEEVAAAAEAAASPAKAEPGVGDDDGDDDEGRASEVDDIADPTAPIEVDPVVAAMAAVEAERDDYKDIALRLQADFDNFRRRVATDRQAEVDRATGKMAESLLPVLDAAEQAFLRHPAEIEPLFNLLLGEMRKLGLESMNLLDQPFDPNLADAVMHEAGGDDGPVVAEVLRSGYTWKGRTLRAAMVKVRG